jgi:hypothetical protein
MNVFGVPMGGEDRWKTAHLDQENMDYTGMPIAGMRTLESYGESIIEDYYDINKRQTDILNPPIRIDGISVEIGMRSVLPISPSCSDKVTGEVLSQYTTAAECHEPNGEWYLIIYEYCEDGTYSTEVNCIEPNGTWTAGSCSGGNWNQESQCLASGICSNNAYNDNETGCLAEGICSNSAFNDNEAGCLAATETWTSAGNTWSNNGYTWTAGSCSDIGFTDQSTCEAPRSVWHPEIPGHCQDGSGGLLPAFTSHLSCDSQRGIWDMTDVSAIQGNFVEITGEGIDLDWVITLDDGLTNIVEQITTPILLPTKVQFEVTESTSLGANTLVITNTEGDFDTYTDPFTVTERMRITSVYQPDPFIKTNGAGLRQVYGPDNNIFGSGGQTNVYPSINGEADFRIYGIEFDSSCTVTMQKSSIEDQPTNYAAGGNNNQIYDSSYVVGGLASLTATWISSTEISVHAVVDDIPVGHDASLGAAVDYGVMYYDVTVTNPDGQTFTEKASTIPGAPPASFNTRDAQLPQIGNWNPHNTDAGNGIRIWRYLRPKHMRITGLTPNGANPPTAWFVTGEGFENDGTNLTSVVTMVDFNGLGTVYHPEVYWSVGMGQTSFNIINSATDIYTGLVPPSPPNGSGDYNVTVTNADGTSDTIYGYMYTYAI